MSQALQASGTALPARGWPRPSRWMVGAGVLWSLVGVAVVVGLLPERWWGWIGGALAGLALVDLLLLLRIATPEASRELADTLAIGMPRPVRLTLEPWQRARVDVHDLHPSGWEAQGLPRRLRLRPGIASSIEYTLRPLERGDARFDGVQLRLHSPLRLWTQSRVAGAAHMVRVFPNFAPLTRFALLSAEQATTLIGAHVRRRRGEGTDFKQLREYRRGDSLRQVDWKATSRARKLISREYQEERNQQVLLALDSGRRMLARDGSLGHFDQALDAALVVAWLALHKGDAVGLHVSGGEHRWVPPLHGTAAIETLLRASYALQPQARATDYLAAAAEMTRLQRRRALVLWVTNVRDEDSDELLAAVQMLRRRHLVVVASLREQALDTVLDEVPASLGDALKVGAAARYLDDRQAAHEALRRHHVTVLDVTSAELPAALVQHYLAIKRAGLL